MLLNLDVNYISNTSLCISLFKMARTELHERLEQELKCALCLSTFSDPKVLPCLHSFCQPCIEYMVSSKTHDKDVIICPTCREPYRLPAGGDVQSSVAKIPSNFMLKGLTELIRSDTCVVRCGNSVDDNAAVCWCMNCRVYLCQTCKTVHEKQKATRTHELVSLEDMKKEEGKSISRAHYCEEHETEDLFLYCKTCQKAICRDCTLITHGKHNYQFIKDMGNHFEAGLKDAVQVLVEKEKEFKGHSRYVTEVETDLNTNFVTSKNVIENAFSMYFEKLSECKMRLLEELDQQYHTEQKAVSAEKERMDLMLTKLSTNLVFCNRLLQSGDGVERATMATSVAEKVASLHGETWDREKLKPLSWAMEAGDLDAFLSAHRVVGTNLSAACFTLVDCSNTHVGPNQATLKVSGDIPDAAVQSLLSVKIEQVPSDVKPATKKTIPTKIVKAGPSSWKLLYFLERRGPYTVQVQCSGVDVPGSPAQCNAQRLLVGTRVRRGSDWKWGMQDTGTGVGKVSLAKDDNWIKVTWDKGSNTNNYRWGAEGAYDVCPIEDELSLVTTP